METVENFSTLFEAQHKEHNFREGTDVPARVLSIERDHVIIDAGLKSESYANIDEFKDDNGKLEIAEGDMVDVEIHLLDDGRGRTILSRQSVKRKRAWRILEDATQNNTAVEGTIRDRIKGGLNVMVHGLRAFLPGSQLDVIPINDVSLFIGRQEAFKIIKLDERRGSIVLSRRAVIEEMMTGEKREEILDKFKEGSVLKGTVKGITDYGAFVDIESGICGLLHVTDMSWRRVKQASDVLSVGEEIDVKVLKVDREKGRISLGRRQLEEDPLLRVEKMYPMGSRFFGKVASVAEYGAFVEIGDGVDGLVHASEMDWNRKKVNPADLVKEGDEVEVMMLEIDKESRRVSLGIKQCKPNPWEEFATAYRKGSRLKGVVRSITEHGLFVRLPGDIDGRVKAYDLSYDSDGEDLLRDYSKGDEIEVEVLNIEPERERIALGVKQLKDDGFDEYATEHLKNTLVAGTVEKIEKHRARVQLEGGIRGVLPAKEVAEGEVEDIGEFLKEGEETQFMLIGFDRRRHEVLLSLKAKDRSERVKKLRQHQSTESKASAPRLGALLKAELDRAQSEQSDVKDVDGDSGQQTEASEESGNT